MELTSLRVLQVVRLLREAYDRVKALLKKVIEPVQNKVELGPFSDIYRHKPNYSTGNYMQITQNNTRILVLQGFESLNLSLTTITF